MKNLLVNAASTLFLYFLITKNKKYMKDEFQELRKSYSELQLLNQKVYLETDRNYKKLLEATAKIDSLAQQITDQDDVKMGILEMSESIKSDIAKAKSADEITPDEAPEEEIPNDGSGESEDAGGTGLGEVSGLSPNEDGRVSI